MVKNFFYFSWLLLGLTQLTLSADAQILTAGEPSEESRSNFTELRITRAIEDRYHSLTLVENGRQHENPVAWREENLSPKSGLALASFSAQKVCATSSSVQVCVLADADVATFQISPQRVSIKGGDCDSATLGNANVAPSQLALQFSCRGGQVLVVLHR